TGASLVTALIPTGLRLSSPRVWKKQTPMSHQRLTGWHPPSQAAIATTRKPRPTQTSAITNFVGLDGSRLPRRIQTQANTGARATRKAEFMDWNQPAGNSH